MNHELMMKITALMPMKTIHVRGEPYLERYFVGVNEHGVQDWLHRFLRSDSEEHLHSHPWEAESTILVGWYDDERGLSEGGTFTRMIVAGETNCIFENTLHRIIDAMPNTWTHMRVYPGREPTWFFIDADGNKKIMESSPADWYLDCKPRGLS
jgi:hypothetical protein